MAKINLETCKPNSNEDFSLHERMARVETLLCHLINNDLQHIYTALKIIIGLLTAATLTGAGAFITHLLKTT
jgi:hypothetical protein